MSRMHTMHFTVRHYECDPYGHVNNSNYLRYMEQAAFDASAAAGYDEARYIALGSLWLIHGTDIEYLQPLKHGDAVEITTWVADFRRVRSQRRYEFRRAGESALVARATSDWVYLDRQTQRPLSVPADMIAAFAPEGTPPASPRESIPPAPPPPSGAFTHLRQVEWRDLDSAQHVNNATYLNYMEEAGLQSLGAFGWSMAQLEAEQIAIVARRHQIEYQQSAVYGDTVRITTFLDEVKRISAVRHFTITRESDGALLARAKSHWVFVNTATQMPTRPPPQVLVDFAPHIAGSGVTDRL
jgi:acyl-CoA thioester hydrolase